MYHVQTEQDIEEPINAVHGLWIGTGISGACVISVQCTYLEVADHRGIADQRFGLEHAVVHAM